MANIDVPRLIRSCDEISRRCTSIANTMHGSAWLFDRLMRFFEKEPAAASVNVPVTINLVGPGMATIGRDGSLIIEPA